jgi:tRNA/tmRNA/rRNA uracil-C5-methylase (TrmA/RlmC/RlmD family)
MADALRATCPAPVDLEWLEDLDGVRAVAALRPARDGPKIIDRDWLPRRDEVSEVLHGCHALGRSGQTVPGWGDDGIVMRLPVCLFVPIGSFFQGNSHLVRWLFDRTAEMIGSRPVPTWDLHAGVGFLAAAALHAASRRLRLVEPFRTAARAAQRNLPTARVAVGQTAEAYLGRARDLPKEALVLTDPTRRGLTSELRRRLSGWHPDRILMLACDPATWARDTGFLLERGYRLDHLELVDLFPSTHHVEVLALLVAE